MHMGQSRRPFIIAFLAIGASTAWGDGHVPPVAEVRSRLAQLGSAVIEEAERRAAKPEGPPHKRSPREEGLYQLSREPRQPVREAIDQVLKDGSKQERIGALVLYDWVTTPTYGAFQQEPL